MTFKIANYTTTFLFIFVFAFASCGHRGHDHEHPHNDSIIEKAEDKNGKEYTSAYICPMYCKGSGSETSGNCPACKMDYVKNKKIESNDHADHDHDDHDHPHEHN